MNERLKYILGFIISAVSIALLWYYKSIVLFLVVSVVLSLIARPIFDLFKKIRIRKWSPSNTLSAFLTTLTLWVIVVTFLRISIPFIIEEIQFLSNMDLDMVFERIEKLLDSLVLPFQQSEFGKAGMLLIQEQIKDAALNLFDFSRLSDLVASFAGFLGNMFIFAFSVTFITFFFLKEEWLIIEGLLLFIPIHYEEGLRHMLNSIKTLLRRYFIGIVLQVMLISIFVTTGFVIVGVGFEHAIIIGLFCGFINVIPYLGPLIGAFFGTSVGLIVYVQLAVPPEFFSFMGGVVLVFVIVQLLDNLIFQPYIFSSSVRAHPLEIFLVILMAGYFAGIMGMFLAIPVYTIIRVVAREFFYNYKLVKKLTEKLRE